MSESFDGHLLGPEDPQPAPSTTSNLLCMLIDALPEDLWAARIFPRLDKPTQAALRTSCRACRTLCDKAIDSLTLQQVPPESIPDVSQQAAALARRLPRLTSISLCEIGPLNLWLGPEAVGLFAASGGAPLQGVTSLKLDSFRPRMISDKYYSNAPRPGKPMAVSELQRLLAALPGLRYARLEAPLLPACFGALAAQHCPQLKDLSLHAADEELPFEKGGGDSDGDYSGSSYDGSGSEGDNGSDDDVGAEGGEGGSNGAGGSAGGKEGGDQCAGGRGNGSGSDEPEGRDAAVNASADAGGGGSWEASGGAVSEEGDGRGDNAGGSAGGSGLDSGICDDTAGDEEGGHNAKADGCDAAAEVDKDGGHGEGAATGGGGSDGDGGSDSAAEGGAGKFVSIGAHVAEVIAGLAPLPCLFSLHCDLNLEEGHEGDCLQAAASLRGLPSLSWCCVVSYYELYEDDGCEYHDLRQFPSVLEDLLPLGHMTGLKGLSMMDLEELELEVRWEAPPANGAGGTRRRQAREAPAALCAAAAAMASLQEVHLPKMKLSQEMWEGVLARMPALSFLVVRGLEMDELLAAEAEAPRLRPLASLKDLFVEVMLRPDEALMLAQALPAGMAACRVTVRAHLVTERAPEARAHALRLARTLAELDLELRRIQGPPLKPPPAISAASQGAAAAAAPPGGDQQRRVNASLMLCGRPHQGNWKPWYDSQQAVAALVELGVAAPGGRFEMLGRYDLDIDKWDTMEDAELAAAFAVLLGGPFCGAEVISFSACTAGGCGHDGRSSGSGQAAWAWKAWAPALAQPARRKVTFHDSRSVSMGMLLGLAVELSACRRRAQLAALEGGATGAEVLSPECVVYCQMSMAEARHLRGRAGEHPGVIVDPGKSSEYYEMLFAEQCCD